MFSHIRQLFAVALVAGVLAGAVATIGHQLKTVPVILAAEAYEQAPAPFHGQTEGHSEPATPAAAHHEADAWSPEDGVERTIYTLLADLLTSIGYGLVLVAILSLVRTDINWRQGLFWGLAGFVVFSVAPSMGLPPKLPGTPVADVTDRQFWWLATAALTGLGLTLIRFGRNPVYALLGIVSLIATHLYGAPAAPAEVSAVPEELTRQFVAAAMVVSLLSWATLGTAVGLLHGRLIQRQV
jgi:cobalt transporter subunit CbtA